MESPFGQSSIAAGYARFRPPVHRRIIHCFRQDAGLQKPFPFRCALDIGCGAGLSTEALNGLAKDRIGIEPTEEMLHWSKNVAPGACFLVGVAEALPFCSQSVDFITAAGSMNYTDLPKALSEAARVLHSDGFLLVYDFHPGRSFRDSAILDHWFAEFTSRYPYPPNEAREVSPEILRQVADGFRMEHQANLKICVSLTPEFYVDYIMTETNVAFALRNGESDSVIRSWCKETLEPIWNGNDHEILFDSYYACLRLQ